MDAISQVLFDFGATASAVDSGKDPISKLLLCSLENIFSNFAIECSPGRTIAEILCRLVTAAETVIWMIGEIDFGRFDITIYNGVGNLKRIMVRTIM